MEFGKVAANEVVKVDFTLPPDGAQKRTLSRKASNSPKFFVGCAKCG